MERETAGSDHIQATRDAVVNSTEYQKPHRAGSQMSYPNPAIRSWPVLHRACKGRTRVSCPGCSLPAHSETQCRVNKDAMCKPYGGNATCRITQHGKLVHVDNRAPVVKLVRIDGDKQTEPISHCGTNKLQAIDNKVPVLKLVKIDQTDLTTTTISSCSFSSPDRFQKNKSANTSHGRDRSVHYSQISGTDESSSSIVARFRRRCVTRPADVLVSESDSLLEANSDEILSDPSKSQLKGIAVVSNTDRSRLTEYTKHHEKIIRSEGNKVHVLQLERLAESGHSTPATSDSVCGIASPRCYSKGEPINTTCTITSFTGDGTRKDDSSPFDTEFNALCLSDSIMYGSEESVLERENMEMSACRAIEACIDCDLSETDGFRMLQCFSKGRNIPPKLAARFFQRYFIDSGNVREISKCFNVFRAMQKEHQEILTFQWEALCGFLNKLVLTGVPETDFIPKVKGILYLQLMTEAFVREIIGTDLKYFSAIRCTSAYRVLSSDFAYPNQKQIVKWLSVLLSNHPPKTTRSSYTLRTDAESQNVNSVELSSMIPFLQTLLALGIDVSTHAVEGAKRLAHLLSVAYMYLPDVSRKTAFITSVRSRLLRLKLIQNILERYSSGSQICTEDFPASLDSLVEAYYFSRPPKNSEWLATGDGVVGDVAVRCAEGYLIDECEELCMLLYHLTYSYLKCSQRKYYEDLKKRAARSKDDLQELKAKDRLSVQRLPQFVEDLDNHLKGIMGDLSPMCLMYMQFIVKLSTIVEEL